MNLTGSALDYIIVFISGIVVSFTPCVYPVMPITASFIGGMNTKGTKMMGFFLSLLYVLGVAIAYCSLAVFAVLTGKVFGQFQNNPIVFLVVANLLIFFALVMLDIIPLGNFGLNVQNKIKAGNIGTVVFAGLISGLVIGPCTAPILGTLLLYVASKQNLLHGISLLFVFSYGVGASLILVGTFSGLLANLPKSGKWMVWVKKICGFILLIIAEVFLIKAGRLM